MASTSLENIFNSMDFKSINHVYKHIALLKSEPTIKTELTRAEKSESVRELFISLHAATQKMMINI